MLWERLEKSQDGKELTIVRPNEDVQKALQNIGEEDPAIILDWDISALNAATAHVNAMGAGVRPAIPTWIGGSYPVSAQALRRVSLRISRCLEVAVRETPSSPRTRSSNMLLLFQNYLA